MPYIYLIVNDKNGKKYVGKADNVKSRWSSHKHNAKIGIKKYLYKSMRKYGIEHFSIKVIEECFNENWSEREMFWISELKPEYNLTPGGEGGDTFIYQSDCSKKKRIKKQVATFKKTRDKNPNWRQQASETAKRLREAGVYDNDEYRQKLSDGIKKAYQNPDVKKRHSIALKRAIKKNLKTWSECKLGKKNGRWLGYLIMICPNKTTKKFESVTECAKETGMAAYRILEKVHSGEAMKRGKFVGYTFKLERD